LATARAKSLFVFIHFLIRNLILFLDINLKRGLKNPSFIEKKPAGRLNRGFFTGFSGKTCFLKSEAF
jgi:hypothetical protein